MTNIVVFDHDSVAAKAVAFSNRALLVEARQFLAPQDPGVGAIIFMPDVMSFDARRIEGFHPGARVEYLGNAPKVPAAEPVKQTGGKAAAKGPGGRWYVKRGKEIVTGPFASKEDADAAIENEASA